MSASRSASASSCGWSAATQADTTGLSVSRAPRRRVGLSTDPGRINFIDVTVDKSTDTVLVRATVPNPKGALVDGQFVRLRVEGNKPAESLVIPQAALLLDQQGAYVFVVADGRAAVRRVKTGEQVGRGIAITEGLQDGDQVIVDGSLCSAPARR